MEPTPPTDREIQHWVRQQFAFLPKLAWIAHCKILCSLPGADARAYQLARFDPSPLERQDAIIKAFRHFKMIS